MAAPDFKWDTEAAIRNSSAKQVFLRILHNSQENTSNSCTGLYFFNMISCKFESTCFMEQLRATAAENKHLINQYLQINLKLHWNNSK